MPIAILAMSLGGFAIGTTEFAMMGLLPVVAHGLGVSIPLAGYLVSAYALGVLVGAPVLTALSTKLPYKVSLVGLMTCFALGNVFVAVAPTYGWELVARFTAGLSHGAFFGIASVVAGLLVDPRRAGSAVAAVLLGLTIANIVGVPGATALGQAVGWRVAFWCVAGIAMLSVVAMMIFVPHVPRDGVPSLRRDVAPFRRPSIWLAMLVTALGTSGLFAAYSYIAPLLIRVSGFTPGEQSLIMVLFGVGMTTGNLLAGPVIDRFGQRGTLAGLASLVVMLVVLHLTAPSKALVLPAVFLLGLAAFVFNPALQAWLIRKSGRSMMVSAGNQGAFNLGNALGAFAGGLVISWGMGYAAAPLTGAVLSASGLVLAYFVMRFTGDLDRPARRILGEGDAA